MIKKLLIIAVMVFACGTLHAQEYDPYKEYRYDYEGSRTTGGSHSLFKDENSNEGGELPDPPDNDETDDQYGMPIGDGIVLLVGLGVAYALRNRKKNE